MENQYLITKNELTKLINVHDQHCVSIYVPTARAGKDIDNKKGQITLKNCLKQVRSELKDYRLNEPEIENYLDPVEKLLDDNHFWRNQSDCLVVLLDSRKMRTFTLPIDHPQFTYVADHFYLLPVLNVFASDNLFYLLNLSLKHIKLYEATRYSIAEIILKGIVPEKLEEVVGYDVRDKSLQFRTGQGGDTGAIFHGQGSGKDEKEIETEKFFRAVDKSLMNIIKNDDILLVLACVDHYFPIFKKVTSYPNLHEKHISGNHEETPPLLLHEMAVEIVDEVTRKRKKKVAEKLKEQSSISKISYDLNDIIPAALDGRIEMLFIEKLKDRYGLYDKINRSIIIDESQKVRQASLFNLAAVQTWLKGGNVLIVEKEEMPFKGTSLNALFRY